VEQAVAETPEAPYRQRVYRVVALGEGFFESRVYSFENPAAFVGAWKKPDPLAELTPEKLIPRDGCSLVLRRQGDAFVGSFLADLCPSERNGAAYATSEAVITTDTLRSWDRGFDASGKQVWGSEKGPYVFRKIGPAAAPPESTVGKPESH
jgi:CpeT protein